MQGPSSSIHPGALSHYVDVASYQRRYSGREEDVAFYTRISRRAGGAVLEYGCGNGRVTLALARAGVPVTGVDASRFMIQDLKRRLDEEPPPVRRRVRCIHGDMRKQRLKRKFRLAIMPFNVFLHLYERHDVECLLARVREHLLPGGRLVFDAYMPRFEELTGELDGHRYDPLSQLLTIDFADEPPSVLCLRQFFPQELRMLLHFNGFERIIMRADFSRRPVDEETQSIIVSATPRA